VPEVVTVLYVLIILDIVAIVSCLFDSTDVSSTHIKSFGYRTMWDIK
jgi:hypothetical protein